MDLGSEKTGGVTDVSPQASSTRVRFRERQILRALDLEAEQACLISIRRRHNIGAHGWGIVKGLNLVKTAEVVTVEPGIAVDGYGRELTVASPLALPADAFTTLGQSRLDVWLLYDLVEASTPQRGGWECGAGRNNRVREQSTLRLTPAHDLSGNVAAVDPRNPIEVPFADLPFLPYRTPPDDPAREWPVYLGTIERRGQTVEVLDVNLGYATLIGELVADPSGSARMQIDAEVNRDTRHFAVRTRDSAGALIERLAVDRDGNTILTGNTTIRTRAEEATTADANRSDANKANLIGNLDGDVATGRLRLRENKDPNSGEEPTDVEPLCAQSTGTATRKTIGAARLVHFQPLPAEPAIAMPWRAYRTSATQNKQNVRQLRFEIAHPGDKGDPKLWNLIVGKYDEVGNVFTPGLTISADGTVTIAGDLDVVGELSEGPITIDPSDPDFNALIASQWVEGTVIGQVTAAPATIQGTVKDRLGAVIPGAAVDLKQATSVLQQATTGSDGRFTFSTLAEGNYAMTVTAVGFVRKEVNVAVVAGETKDLEITLELPPAPATIQGNVKDPLGASVPGAAVDLKKATTVLRQTTTSGKGRFTISTLAAGNYTITVTAAGFVRKEVNVAVAAGETKDLEITLELPPAPAGIIQGIVIDSSGASAPNTTVKLKNVSTGVLKGVATTDDAVFVFPGLLPGAYQVSVELGGGAETTPVNVNLTSAAGESLVLKI